MELTMCLTMGMPSPVPSERERPSMTNGSKRCSTNSGAMPMPSSDTTSVMLS